MEGRLTECSSWNAELALTILVFVDIVNANLGRQGWLVKVRDGVSLRFMCWSKSTASLISIYVCMLVSYNPNVAWTALIK